jgi:hypothetical protein
MWDLVLQGSHLFHFYSLELSFASYLKKIEVQEQNTNETHENMV